MAGPQAADPGPAVVDVALGEGGTFTGQLVDPQGEGQAGVAVRLVQGDREIAVGRTDSRGHFAFRGLRGGTYLVQSDRGHGVCRLWAPGTAPPSATPAVLLVAGGELLRGQWMDGAQLRNKLLLKAAACLMVAVPLAVGTGASCTVGGGGGDPKFGDDPPASP
jgi:hypothetical protein